MHVYELETLTIRRFIVAESEEQAKQIGTDPAKHPDLHFRPFSVRKVEIEGYSITVTPENSGVEQLDRDGLKEWLSKRDIEFVPQWGEQKLRELALQHA